MWLETRLLDPAPQQLYKGMSKHAHLAPRSEGAGCQRAETEGSRSLVEAASQYGETKAGCLHGHGFQWVSHAVRHGQQRTRHATLCRRGSMHATQGPLCTDRGASPALGGTRCAQTAGSTCQLTWSGAGRGRAVSVGRRRRVDMWRRRQRACTGVAPLMPGSWERFEKACTSTAASVAGKVQP